MNALDSLRDVDRLAYAFEVLSAHQYNRAAQCIVCRGSERVHARQDHGCKLTDWLEETAALLDAPKPIEAEGIPATLEAGTVWRHTWRETHNPDGSVTIDDEADAVDAFRNLGQGVQP